MGRTGRELRGYSGAEQNTNGLGNLIVGYQELRNKGENNRTGSHNIVVGNGQNYSVFGGFLAGQFNTISGAYASVTAARHSTASNGWSSVSGGLNNTASGAFSSVSGGRNNRAIGVFSSVSGGDINFAEGVAASAGGGRLNVANGDWSTVSGGENLVAASVGEHLPQDEGVGGDGGLRFEYSDGSPVSHSNSTEAVLNLNYSSYPCCNPAAQMEEFRTRDPQLIDVVRVNRPLSPRG